LSPNAQQVRNGEGETGASELSSSRPRVREGFLVIKNEETFWMEVGGSAEDG
jgi:hypothetical protein